MTTLDDYWPPVEPREAPETPRRHRHVWEPRWQGLDTESAFVVMACRFCPAIRDETKARRGKSSRRLGGDQERRIERVYGPVKIGERGDPVDHIGRVWRWQSKATRSLPPRWLAAITKPTPRKSIPASLARAWQGMDGLYGGRRSVVIRSFVRHGVPTRDWLFVWNLDAANELGLLEDYAWHVIPGDWWLDNFGRDE